MKVVNPMGRSLESTDNGGVITPRGCMCSSKKNNFTEMRKGAGSCKRCVSSCNDFKGVNYNANYKAAKKKGSY